MISIESTRRVVLAVVIVLIVLAVKPPSVLAQIKRSVARSNWPEFRGPTGDGKAIGAKLPTDFTDASCVQWKTKIHGKGWSSPVIWDDQIWLTTATFDGKTMSAICVDYESGEIIHDLVIHQNDDPDDCHPTNSYASPTPVIESDRVYLHFGSYGTTCLDAATGKQIWQRTDLPCDHFRGPASSPILYKHLLIVSLDGFDHQYVVAIDKLTGETVWKRDREIEYGTKNGDYKKAFGTASVFDVNEKMLVVCPSAIATIAYRPDTGETVWTVYHGGMNASARPLMTQEGNVIIANGTGKMIAVDPRGAGNITDSNIVWSQTRAVIKKPSPLIIDDRLYMVSDRGIASCIDTEDGSVVWQKRMGGTFSASPVFDGTNIFAFDEDGVIQVFEPGDQFKSVSKTTLGDGFRASPAISGNRLILRSLSHLYCIKQD